MDIPSPPSYDGRGLVNLVADIEHRLSGSAEAPTLHTEIGHNVPQVDGYVVVLFDGLGHHQLDHANASDLQATSIGTLDAPFSTMTTVSLATIATGRPPSQHGLVGYKMWLEEHTTIINTIHMSTAWGEAMPNLDTDSFLPRPNLWERLVASGIEPIVVQPGNFATTGLTSALYRGARFEGYWSPEEAVQATVDLAGPGRLVFLYLPHVDFSAHVSGQASPEYSDAMRLINRAWADLCRRLPENVGLIGTADHGHVDIPEAARIELAAKETSSRITEDGRILYVHGDDGPDLAARFGGAHVAVDVDSPWWGPDLIETARARLPDSIVFLPPGLAVLTPHGNARLTGFHGGLTDEERTIPLLIRS